jgi:succinyl-diaminopimelate desuccinylase
MNITIFGKTAHTGASEKRGENAIVLASTFIERVSRIEMKDLVPWLEAVPRVTVTSVHGGQSFSVVPDICEVGVDCRVTKINDAAWADALVINTLRESGINRHKIDIISSYPAYSSYDSVYANILTEEASNVFSKKLRKRIAGPSNIGNALMCLGIPSTCGFGVSGIALHAPDECANVSEVIKVYMGYLNSIVKIMN